MTDGGHQIPGSALTLGVAIVTLLVSAGGCAAQSAASAPPAAADLSARQFVLPAEFRIEGRSSSGYDLQIMRSGPRSWSAVLGMGGEAWTATERNCPAFATALQAFGELPPLEPGPYELRHDSRTRQPGPRTPHGEFWTLTLAGFAPDHTSLDMEISGSQGPYPQWASETASAIRSCGQTAP